MIKHNIKDENYKGFIMLLPFTISFLILSNLFLAKNNKTRFYFVKYLCFLLYYLECFLITYYFIEFCHKINDVQKIHNIITHIVPVIFICSITLLATYENHPYWIDKERDTIFFETWTEKQENIIGIIGFLVLLPIVIILFYYDLL